MIEIYSEPGSVLQSSHVLAYLIFTQHHEGVGILISMLRDRERLSNLPISNSLGSRTRIQIGQLGSPNSHLNLCTLYWGSNSVSEVPMKSNGYLKEFYKECLQEEGKKERQRKKEGNWYCKM